MYRKTLFLSLVAILIFGITDTVLALDLKTQAQNEVIDDFLNQFITGLFFVSLFGIIVLITRFYPRITGKRFKSAEAKEGELEIASRLRRFTNVSVDYLIGINIIITAIAYGAIAIGWYALFENWFLFSVGTIVLYYLILEGLFGRTIGKLLTNTKVVFIDGSRPNTSAILARTLIRLIPFESFSFLGKSASGWHDKWSKTVVARVGYKNKLTNEQGILLENGFQERPKNEGSWHLRLRNVLLVLIPLAWLFFAFSVENTLDRLEIPELLWFMLLSDLILYLIYELAIYVVYGTLRKNEF